MTKKNTKLSKSEGLLKLTKKNIRFLHYLAEGKKIAEAYNLSGYKGGTSASYDLYWRLKNQMVKVFESKGFTRDRYKAELLKLLDLPCIDSKGNELKSLTFNQREVVLKLFRDELPTEPNKRPQITNFIINRHMPEAKGDSPNGNGTNEEQVIDATVIPISEPLVTRKREA